MSLCCGFCAVGRHHECSGFLRTEFGFCSCATRDHQPKPSVEDPIVRARNEAIYLETIRHSLHAGEA